MRQIVKALVALTAIGFSLPVQAAGVEKSRTDLYAEIAAQLASGQTPPISASQLRTVLNDMVASVSAIFQDTSVDLNLAGLTVGNPLSGNLGLGTVNVASGLYVNGKALAGAGTVTSVTCGDGLTGGAITNSGTCAVDTALNANVWGGTANKILDTHVAQTSIAPVALVISTSTFTPNFALGINEDITLIHASCPCIIASPTNTYAGLSGFLTIVQSSTGSDTVTWGSNWKFAGGSAPTLTTTANAVDILPYYCRTTSFCLVGFSGDVK